MEFEFLKKDFSDEDKKIIEDMISKGNTLGEEKLGREEWTSACESFDKRIRLVCPPLVEGNNVKIYYKEIDWGEIMAYRQVMENVEIDLNNKDSYINNCLVLTVNGILLTSDNKLVFHKKKKKNTDAIVVHSFGGYVDKKDFLSDNVILTAIRRELSETDEIGLTDLELVEIFGTENGFPSITFGFGTMAYYALFRTKLNSEEIQEHMDSENRGESFTSKLTMINLEELASSGIDWHPQTKNILGVLDKILKRE